MQKSRLVWTVSVSPAPGHSGPQHSLHMFHADGSGAAAVHHQLAATCCVPAQKLDHNHNTLLADSKSRSRSSTAVCMALKTGIVGLPNVGKVTLGPPFPEPSHSQALQPSDHSPAALQSTMFNALCENGKAEAANYPFCTIEPNVGIVAVPDERLEARRRPLPRAQRRLSAAAAAAAHVGTTAPCR